MGVWHSGWKKIKSFLLELPIMINHTLHISLPRGIEDGRENGFIWIEDIEWSFSAGTSRQWVRVAGVGWAEHFCSDVFFSCLDAGSV